jgi:hypothetical protein
VASFSKTVRLGAGIAGLGYGLYRLNRGRNDWTTTAFLTTGASLAINALTGRQVGPDPVSTIANAVTSSIPGVSRTAATAMRSAMHHAPANAGWMP